MTLAESRRGGAAALAALGVWLCLGAGCALQPRPLALQPHLRWNVSAPAPAEAPSLGVLPFADARDVRARRGVTPPLRVHWAGLLREGEHRTGDAWFARGPAEIVRADVEATLLRSGVFARVRSVEGPAAPGDVARLALWQREPDLDYLLGAAVEVFEGRQYQSQIVSPLRVGGYRNHFDPPLARARVHYRLWSRAGLVWQGRVDETRIAPAGDLADALRSALAANSESVADQVWVEVCRDCTPRRIPVRVLDACGVGQRGAQHLLAAASSVFQREAGVAFAAEHLPLRAVDGEAMRAAFARVRGATPPETGFVVGLVPVDTGPFGLLPDDRAGLADAYGRHLVVGCDRNGDVPVGTLLHEIAHLFGAVHVREPGSIMHPVALRDARLLDPLNRRIVRECAPLAFRGPFPSERVARLRSIYRAAARHPESVDAADLEAVVAALARRAGGVAPSGDSGPAVAQPSER